MTEKYKGAPIVAKIMSNELEEPISSIWDKEKGLLICIPYFTIEQCGPTQKVHSHETFLRINRDKCKEMVKDLLDEIRKEEAGEVLD